VRAGSRVPRQVFFALGLRFVLLEPLFGQIRSIVWLIDEHLVQDLSSFPVLVVLLRFQLSFYRQDDVRAERGDEAQV
jgi:hypothetical protein